MIGKRQKMFLHIYKAAAGINEATYRNVLLEAAGVRSSADRRFTQAGYDKAMAALESMLFCNVDAGLVPDPIGASKWIQREHYWRRKLPDSGFLTSRQAFRIKELWSELQRYLPGEQQDVGYLAAIIFKAAGKKDIGFAALRRHEADLLISALQDRLAYARQNHPELEDVPF